MGVARLGFRGVVGKFFQRLDPVVADDWAPMVAMRMDTDQASEEYRWLGMTPAVREWIGGRQASGLRESGITIANKTYEATLDVNADELRRDKSSQILLRVGELAGRVREHWDKLLSALIVTPGNAYDGQGFYDTDHAEGDSGTQINLCAAAQLPGLDITTAASPTVEEAQVIMLQAIAYMMGYKDDKGEPLNANAKGFGFMVPLNMYMPFAQAATMPLIASGSGAKTNILANMPSFQIKVFPNPRLSTTTVLYMFRIDAEMKPFIMQEELLDIGEQDDTFLNNRILYGVKAIRAVGTAFWQYAMKMTTS